MFRRQTHLTTAPSKRRAPNKLIAGLAALLATGVITTASLAAAAPNNKPSKEWCMQHHYTNYGQCVKAWAQARGQGNGHGYGGRVGDNNINLAVNLSNSKDNVINIIVNIFR